MNDFQTWQSGCGVPQNALITSYKVVISQITKWLIDSAILQLSSRGELVDGRILSLAGDFLIMLSPLHSVWTGSLSDFFKKNMKFFCWAVLVTDAKILLYKFRAVIFELHWEVGSAGSDMDVIWGNGKFFWIRENYISSRNDKYL